jgi:hypothetical protein
MSWEIILKSLGNIQSRFRKNDIPTKEEVDASDEASKRNLDTGITSLREQYNSSIKGEDIPNTVITQMITGRLSKVGKDREDSLKIIGERLKQWESLLGSNTNELYEKTIAGIKYSDLVEVGNKTNKEWTIETLNALYQKMITESSVELLYAIHYFIDSSTAGQWTKKNGWKNLMGKKSIENPDPEFLKNVFNLRSDPDVTGGIDKKVFDFFTDEYKYTTEGMKNIEIAESPMRQKKTGKETRIKTVGSEVVMAERKSLELLIPSNLGEKLNGISQVDFRNLIDNLNKTNSGSRFTKALKGKGINIVYDLMLNPQPLNALVRDIDIRRQGHSISQRKRATLQDWAISYVNRKLKQAQDSEDEDITINDTTVYTNKQLEIFRKGNKEENIEPNPKKLRQHYNNKKEIIEWLKTKVRTEDDTWVKRYQDDIRKRRDIEQKWSKLSEEDKKAMTNEEKRDFLSISDTDSAGKGFKTIGYTIKTDSDVESFADMFNLGNKRYIRNMISILFDYYMSGDKDSAYDKSSELITSNKSFTMYIPTGNLFADTSKTTFVDSMRAILTFIKILHGRESLVTYNDKLGGDIMDKFLDNLDKIFQEVAEENGLDLDDKEEIFEIIETEELIDDSNLDSILGTKTDFLEIYDILNGLVDEFEEKVLEELTKVITKIALDTEDTHRNTGLSINRKSGGIREYLISKKLLEIPTPPSKKKINGVNHMLKEGTQTKDLDAELIYYPYEKNKSKDTDGVLIDKDKPYKTTLRELLGDE